MKMVGKTIGWIMMLWTLVCTVTYWSNIWGGVGFFGAIITMPLSVLLYLLFTAFNSIWSFIGNIIWTAVMIWLVSLD